MKKFVYSKWFRVLMFFVMLFSAVIFALSIFVIYEREDKFYLDDLEKVDNFAETKAICDEVNQLANSIYNMSIAYKKIQQIDKNKSQVKITDYQNMSDNELTIADVENSIDKDILDIAYNVLEEGIYYDENGNEYNLYNYYKYSLYDFSGDKKFLRISNGDYWKLINKYTTLNTEVVSELPEGVSVTRTDADKSETETEATEIENFDKTPIYEEEIDEDYIEEKEAAYEESNTTDISIDKPFNSLNRNDNSKCMVVDISDENSESDVKQYKTTINVNFGDDCYIYQSGDETFLYSLDENVMYNDLMGWVSLDSAYISKYFYIPIEFIDFTSEETEEQSILLAPQFTSTVPVLFAGMDYDYIDILSQAIYSRYECESNKAIYCSASDKKNPLEIITNANSYSDVDIESYEDCNKAVLDNSDLIIEYNGETQAEESYYLDEENNKINVNYLSNNTLKYLKLLGSEFEMTIGINITKNPDSSYFYWQSVMFDLCKRFENSIVYFVMSLILMIISIVSVTKVAGVKILDNGEKCIQELFIDKIPYEFVFVIGNGVIIVAIRFIVWALKLWVYDFRTSTKAEFNMAFGILLSILIITLAFICYEIYLSFVRRVKAKKLINELLIVRICKSIKTASKSMSGRGKGAKVIVAKYTMVFIINLFVTFFDFSVLQCDTLWKLLILIMLVIFDTFIVMNIVKYATGIDEILKSTNKIVEGEMDAKVDTDCLIGNCVALGKSINSMREGLKKAVMVSTRDERMKAELITNVSHDIKTPLTSIINYVALIKREDIQNERVNDYVKILDQKSQRLKQLIEDLVEASKASTGNIEFECMNLNLIELLQQTVGEFGDRFVDKNLDLVINMPLEPMIIYADGRRSFRIIENIFQNAYKYSMPGTRVYLDVASETEKACLKIRNVSEAPLNISPDELTERFVRGDAARTTEGSGLGLSIAKNLTELQGGEFEIDIDGDLFTVIVKFPLAKRESDVENKEETVDLETEKAEDNKDKKIDK